MFSLIQVAFPFETKKKGEKTKKKKTPLTVVADQFCVSSGCGFVTEDWLKEEQVG